MKSRQLILFLILFTIVLNTGCKKNPFDYRTKYVGDYNFVNSWTSYNMAATPPTSSGTTYSTGKIDYGKSGEINITFDNNYPTYIQELEIDRDGNLSFSNGLNAGKCDRKKMHYSHSTNGLGGGGTTNISGTKK